MLHLMENPNGEHEGDIRIKIGKLPCIVMCWFAAHMEEELTADDIALKFSCESKTVNARLDTLVRTDVLIKRRIGISNIYSAGPMLFDMVFCRKIQEE